MKQTRSVVFFTSILLGLGSSALANVLGGGISPASPLLVRAQDSAVDATPIIKRDISVALFRRQSSSCPSSQEQCGTGCMPAGEVCCETVGIDAFCPAGSRCAADGSCSSSSGGGSGGGSGGTQCRSTEEQCGTGCMPAGEVCCESVGIDAFCPAGAKCSANGSCSSSSGGGSDGGSGGGSSGGSGTGSGGVTCSSGETVCATGCMPKGSVCCASDEKYCPSGATCIPGGKCLGGKGNSAGKLCFGSTASMAGLVVPVLAAAWL